MYDMMICTVEYTSSNDFDKGPGLTETVFHQPMPLDIGLCKLGQLILNEYHHPGHTINAAYISAKINNKIEPIASVNTAGMTDQQAAALLAALNLKG